MTQGIFRQNRLVIVLAIVTLTIMSAVAYLQSEQDKGGGHPSSYSNLPKGGKAAYLLLQQSGYPVERWDRLPQNLPTDAQGILLIVASPESYPRSEESDAFARFLLHGGTILAAGMLPDAFVTQADATTGELRVGGIECKPAAPTRLTRGGSISMDGVFKWASDDTTPLVHFVDNHGNAVVVSYPAGKGSVVWWASAWPLENAGIREKNNLELLLNSASGYKRVLWDEYYHNEHTAAAGHKPVVAYKWALGQLALMAIALVLTFSRRSGPLVPRLQPSRLAPLEFVETLGNLFRRAHSTHVAIEIAFQRFRQIAVRRLGIRGTSNASEIVEAMSQRGFPLPESTAALVRASEAAANDSTLTEKSALQYVRALNFAARAMEPANTNPAEKTAPSP